MAHGADLLEQAERAVHGGDVDVGHGGGQLVGGEGALRDGARRRRRRSGSARRCGRPRAAGRRSRRARRAERMGWRTLVTAAPARRAASTASGPGASERSTVRYPTSHSDRPYGGATWPAASRSRATRMPRTSPGERLAEPDVDERADDRAHHLVAERVGPDLEAQVRRVVQRRPAGRQHAPHQRRLGSPSATFGRRQNEVKSCSPISGSHAACIAQTGQRLGHEPGPPGEQRVRRRRRSTRRSGSAATSPRSGRRSRRRPTSAVAHGDRRRAQLVQPPGRGRRGRSSAGRSPETTWPQAWTPASVRPAPVSSTGWRTTVAIASASVAITVRTPGLRREPAERAPRRRRRRAEPVAGRSAHDSVVRDRPDRADAQTTERAQTSSMRAISAVSPWRAPSLRMRV